MINIVRTQTPNCLFFWNWRFYWRCLTQCFTRAFLTRYPILEYIHYKCTYCVSDDCLVFSVHCQSTVPATSKSNLTGAEDVQFVAINGISAVVLMGWYHDWCCSGFSRGAWSGPAWCPDWGAPNITWLLGTRHVCFHLTHAATHRSH